MSTQPIEVSVLIPVLNEEADLRAAAEAMLAQEFEGRLEFLFIDGGSTDASPDILAALAAADQRVRVLRNPARRTPHALNVGLRAAQGEFVARMDAHAMYPRNYLASGVARLRRGDVAWVAGPQVAVGTDRGSARVARALATPLGRGGAGFRERLAHERVVDSGFTGVWRRDLLIRYRGWDEEWLNDQDVELAARIRRDGGTIVCIPEMAAEYIPRATAMALARQYGTYGLYRVKTARRHPETLRPSQLLPIGVTSAIALSLIGPARWLRRGARTVVATYGATMTAAAVRAGRQGGTPRQAAGLPLIWVTMHVSYGVGFLGGCTRFGPPASAVGRAITRAAVRVRTSAADAGASS